METNPLSLRPPTSALRWFALAIVALAGAGMLASVLVLTRVPGVASALDLDPALATRSLVVHVNLATGVWFFAVLAGLACLAETFGPSGEGPVTVAVIGVVVFLAAAVSPAAAVLSDYVPVLDHPAFFVGLATFAAGVAFDVVRPRAFTSDRWLPREVRYGVRAAGYVFVIAMATTAAAYLCRDPTATPAARYQHLFWGGGHVLQFAATAAMVATWLFLFRNAVGVPALASTITAIVFALLVAPAMLGPILVLTRQSPAAFTSLMEVGIFPAVVLVVVAGASTARRHGRPSDLHWPVQPIAERGLIVGVGMTLLGFALGAAIRGDTTLTPAHYHISIGAVTVSFMTTLLVLLPRFGAPLSHPRLAMWQPVLYGGGQTVFALGLAIAGFWGSSGRKLYDASQHVMASAERIGWIVAGLGGLLAFAGGIAFIALVVGSTRRLMTT
ncbi:MAG: hypothetical protein HOV81_29565 [Kofleriaceae bacterium]|nr:hypothetical protein [Kofleriaceae bacterium]